MDQPVNVELSVNGRREARLVEPRTTLADFLRSELGLVGTHLGCEQGVCGACTVIVDGRAVRSCLLFACQLDGSVVETVEGLRDAGGLHPLQEAFWNSHAVQCGFCTSGFLMTAVAALREGVAADREALRARLAGNLCRCTGYEPIVDAVLAVVRSRSDEGGRR